MILRILLHEFEHVKQSKEIDQNKKNVETKLLSTAFPIYVIDQLIEEGTYKELSEEEIEDYTKKRKQFNKDFYTQNPAERIAEIETFKQLRNIVNIIKKECPNVYDFFSKKYHLTYIRGYDFNKKNIFCSPTKLYLEGLKFEKAYFDFSHHLTEVNSSIEKNDYSLKEKMRLGLPIEFDELENYKKNKGI